MICLLIHYAIMYQQSQIRRHLTSPEGVARLQALMDAESFKNRSAVGRQVCEEFGFHDACGGAQLVGCMKVLRDLDAAEEIRLPASTRAKRQVKARRLGYAVDAAEWYYPDNICSLNSSA